MPVPTAIGEPPEPAGSTTYSTRFNPKQRELIEAAARLMNWSPANLIREASVKRAADLVNAAGGSHGRLRELASLVLGQLLNPKVLVKQQTGNEYQTADTMTLYSYREATLPDVDPSHFDPDYVQFRNISALTPQRPYDADLAQIRRALETSGTAFVEMLLDQWAGVEQPQQYEPKVSAADLLHGGEGEASGKEAGR